MATDKTRMNNLIKWADQALREQETQKTKGISKILNGNDINESYNGSVAALGVSIAMGELRPALAIYYQDKQEKDTATKANRRSVLDVIARVITKEALAHNNNNCYNFSPVDGKTYADVLFQYVINNEDPMLKAKVIESAIALKHVVRTYNLVKNEQSA